jgi:hypothetical protein
VTLIASCDHFRLQAQATRDSFGNLQVMTTQDHPTTGAVALVEIISTALDDILGWLDETLEAANRLRRAAVRDNLTQAQRWLTTSQRAFERVMHAFFADLVSYTRLADLMRLGRTRGSEWRIWAMSVRRMLEAHMQSILEMNQTCFLCWAELANCMHLPALPPGDKSQRKAGKGRKKS